MRIAPCSLIGDPGLQRTAQSFLRLGENEVWVDKIEHDEQDVEKETISFEAEI